MHTHPLNHQRNAMAHANAHGAQRVAATAAVQLPEDFMFQLNKEVLGFKPANCKLKDRAWSASQIPALRLHGTQFGSLSSRLS